MNQLLYLKKVYQIDISGNIKEYILYLKIVP
jgi:hypothetical protein